jgi:Kef-type K+ transport system membrane component KefB
MAAGAAAVAADSTAAGAGPWWSAHLVQAFMIALILAPFSYYMGQAFKQLKLPQITGYLVSGIVCGPYLLGLLSMESVRDLNIIEGACLSIIGLAAGAELHLGELARSRKQVRTACYLCEGSVPRRAGLRPRTLPM